MRPSYSDLGLVSSTWAGMQQGNHTVKTFAIGGGTLRAGSSWPRYSIEDIDKRMLVAKDKASLRAWAETAKPGDRWESGGSFGVGTAAGLPVLTVLCTDDVNLEDSTSKP